MYVDDPRDSAFEPRREDEPSDARTKYDEEDTYDANRPRTTLYHEEFYEE
ncbi:MAG TPA: hypothetical protein VFE17_05570 [Candidatus Baltobacteraceae bacterium]|jgi:hypothetical protein|nr:hypothetical protein [Candidatus Baltobacteraceae bacterium]